jgi:KUP system potassium uptake protein
MGHFGRRPIQLGWFYLVFPALLLNYFGQGALLLRAPQTVENLFYHLAPAWGLYPLVALATVSTVIASQAVISGAFSLTRQAVQLGYSPRLTIRQTSSEEIGQVYLPAINWILLAVVLGLVLSFRASGSLAAAYGVAVATTMLITTLFLYGVAHRVWGWSSSRALLLTGAFLLPTAAFFTSTLIKVKSGGWLPLLVGLCIYILMATWREGREVLRRRLESQLLPLDLFISDIQKHPPLRVPRTAIFLTGNTSGVPVVLLHNLKHNQVLHQTIVLLTVQTEEIPHVPPEEQVKVEALGCGVYRVVLRYGFSENPDIPATLQGIRAEGFHFELMKSTFFLGRENLIVGPRSPISKWRGALFSFMSHNALDATKFFKIPHNLVVELGIQVEL